MVRRLQWMSATLKKKARSTASSSFDYKLRFSRRGKCPLNFEASQKGKEHLKERGTVKIIA